MELRKLLTGTLSLAAAIALVNISTVQAEQATTPIPEFTEAEQFDGGANGYLIKEPQGILPAPDQEEVYGIAGSISDATVFTEAIQKNAGRQKLTFNLEPLIDVYTFKEASDDAVYLRRSLETFVHRLTIPEAGQATFAIQRSTEALQDAEFREQRSGVICFDEIVGVTQMKSHGQRATSAVTNGIVRLGLDITALGAESHGVRPIPWQTLNTNADAVHVRPVPIAGIFSNSGSNEIRQ